MRLVSRMIALMAAVWCCLAALPALAEVKLPAVLGDNMVLQQGMKVPVWGTADPGEEVTVTCHGQRVSGKADAQGKWMVHLEPLTANTEGTDLTVAGQDTITLRNVLVGEVWVGSGQSNMEFPVAASRDAEPEIAAANYPSIRLFTVEKAVADRPLDDCKGAWAPCSPQTVGDFSAVAYFFGRELHRRLGVPVGLIDSSWGGTPAESWTSRGTLVSHPNLKYMVDNWDNLAADYPRALEEYNKQLKAWEQAAADAQAKGEAAPAKPNEPANPANPWRPASLYNGMIAPLLPYAIRGAIWYQGESNAGRAYQYRELFPTMIRDWRQSWQEGDFPFLFVQLANFMAAQPNPGDSAWAELREAQSMTLRLANTGMAVIIDIGDAVDIHPRNKQDVGYRLALWPLALVHGERIEYSGPLYESMSVEGERIRLRFTHVDGGLVARSGPPLKGFAIAGEDRRFVWANAQIEGDTVVVWSDQVASPAAVRYAWADNPICNLYNRDRLPASPFRTDDWPGVTADAK